MDQGNRFGVYGIELERVPLTSFQGIMFWSMIVSEGIWRFDLGVAAPKEPGGRPQDSRIPDTKKKPSSPDTHPSCGAGASGVSFLGAQGQGVGSGALVCASGMVMWVVL